MGIGRFQKRVFLYYGKRMQSLGGWMEHESTEWGSFSLISEFKTFVLGIFTGRLFSCLQYFTFVRDLYFLNH
jgi:hypothetical protein